MFAGKTGAILVLGSRALAAVNGRVATLTDTSPQGVLTCSKRRGRQTRSVTWRRTALVVVSKKIIVCRRSISSCEQITCNCHPGRCLFCSKEATNAPRGRLPRAGDRQHRRVPRRRIIDVALQLDDSFGRIGLAGQRGCASTLHTVRILSPRGLVLFTQTLAHRTWRA